MKICIDMKNTILLSKSIEHWEEIVREIEGEVAGNPNGTVYYDLLTNTIYSEGCPLCKEYLIKSRYGEWKECSGSCPLIRAKMGCEYNGSVWDNMYFSHTWTEALYNSKQMLAFLKGIRRH
jgi:hypothetical protein